MFGAALLLLIGSLGVSIWEIQISVRALEIHLHDMEKYSPVLSGCAALHKETRGIVPMTAAVSASHAIPP